MGKTLAVYKLMPEEPGMEKGIAEAIAEAMKGLGEVRETKFEAIAFGLVAVKVAILFPEKQEDLEKTEANLRAIPNVADVTMETMTLL
ncbi:MAG: hypothetical protein WC602_04705 [archaeon]